MKKLSSETILLIEDIFEKKEDSNQIMRYLQNNNANVSICEEPDDFEYINEHYGKKSK